MSLSRLYLGYFIPAFTLVPVIAGLFLYNGINKPLRVLLIYLVTSFVFNVTGSVLAGFGINNLPGLHLYTVAEVLTIMLYYLYAFDKGLVSRWIKMVMIVFPVICIVNFSFFQSIYEFNTYTRPLGAIIVIVFTAAYLAMQSGFKNQQLIKRSGRLVASGFMIYFCSSLFQFIFSNVISKHAAKGVKLIIWNIHGTFVLIMYLLFLWAIIYERPKRQY
ncbi:hypothetical protein [Mucilaginibacter auburnensis]|uniref:Uncharacterized protein n=1 Tax=Mucilaginibacter auburnensis TaxID=1457233 RepID=A0A2H9VS04_9SPHI|nr:hypothetical protein [Mucilaginibacter auburnensis]PJJ83600.1 hypothetical protein CLV57_0585 [Mucilaginibacter auburnensis]